MLAAAYPSGLVSYWSMDSNANDALGLHNGTVYGATLNSTGGKVGGAYAFDNSSSTYIDFGNSSDFNGSASFTVSAWIRPLGTGNRIILYRRDPNSPNYGWQFYIRSDATGGDLIFAIDNADGFQYVHSDFNGFSSQPGWYYVAATVNGSSMSVYVNGALNGTATFTNAIENVPTSLLLGKAGFGANYFNGTIDEVAIFDRPLTAAEVSQFYNNSRYGVENYFGDCRHSCPSFGPGTPNDSAVSQSQSAFINVTVNSLTALSNFNFSWNGTNYSLYDSSLVGMWNFDNSTPLSDLSGYSNNLACSNCPALVSDSRSGEAYSFDGSSNYLERGYDADFTPGSSNWTVSAWFKKQPGTAKGVLVDWYRCGAATPACYSQDSAVYTLFVSANNSAGFYARGDDAVGMTLYSAPDLPGGWHQAVGTFSSTSDNIYLYLDGVLVNSSSVALASLSSGSVQIPLEIGREYIATFSPPINYFNGSIDEARIYRRQLGAAEVRQLYLAELRKINSTQWEFTTNQTNVGDGVYTYAGYATDSQGYTGSTGARSITMLYGPSAFNFNGSTTDFASIANLSNVTNMTLEIWGRGRIRFPESHAINTVGEDYDSNVVIGNGFISANSAALDTTFNSSASLELNLTGIYSGPSAPAIYYYHAFATDAASIVANGAVCTSPRCTGITWNSSTQMLVFTVSGFSGYAANGSQYFAGAGSGQSNTSGTLGLNITSTNQIAIYTASSKSNTNIEFVPVSPPPPAPGSPNGFVALYSNESSNITGGDTGFLVENQGNVNVSITATSDKDAALFIGGSSPLFQMFGAENKTNSCPSVNASMQDLSASAITICPSLAYADSQDTIWAYVLVKIDSDSPPETSTATLTFTSTQV